MWRGHFERSCLGHHQLTQGSSTHSQGGTANVDTAPASPAPWRRQLRLRTGTPRLSSGAISLLTAAAAFEGRQLQPSVRERPGS
jgi:hypothetical protein